MLTPDQALNATMPVPEGVTPDARALASWLADLLQDGRPVNISRLAAAALNGCLDAPLGSEREIVLGVLSDALHQRMVDQGDGPEEVQDAAL